MDNVVFSNNRENFSNTGIARPTRETTGFNPSASSAQQAYGLFSLLDCAIGRLIPRTQTLGLIVEAGVCIALLRFRRVPTGFLLRHARCLLVFGLCCLGLRGLALVGGGVCLFDFRLNRGGAAVDLGGDVGYALGICRTLLGRHVL